MSPITHFLIGWTALERFQLTRRDKAIVVLAGVLPDLDGLGIVADFVTRAAGLAETNYYQEFHRMIGHGLPAALLIAALAGLLGRRRLWTAAGAFASVHLHFLCDLIGSRGTTAEDIWGIYYFAPLTTRWEWAWAGQWPLVGWQNMLITMMLLFFVLRRATITGYSPLGLLSVRGDAALVATLRQWKLRIGALTARRQ